MYKLIVKEGYRPLLNIRETEKAIKIIKDSFENNIARALNLERVTAPLIVKSGSGLNDDLSGVERKVTFDFKEMTGEAEIVQSLAKWKRFALHKYGFEKGEGIYTDMNALRRDDVVDNTHSIFVDQWDWEKIIDEGERTIAFLESVVKKIVSVICDTHEGIKKRYPQLTLTMERDVKFISSQELLDLYPKLESKERERQIAKEYKTVFITQIGGNLSNGERHDQRAPDYDDWQLNGDLLVWNELLNDALELSSMGIRVCSESLIKQLKLCRSEERLKYEYHKKIAENILPLTIGGGIGQSRLCMHMLEKMHIGEVQVSIWPCEMQAECEAAR